MACQIVPPLIPMDCPPCETKPWAMRGIVSGIDWPAFYVGAAKISFTGSEEKPGWLQDGISVEVGFNGTNSYLGKYNA